MKQKNERYLILFLLTVVALVIGLGRMEFHNELEREELQNVFLGYLDAGDYKGAVTISREQWPVWTKNMEVASATTITFKSDTGGRIGIFADLVYYENRFERRTWLTGKLLKQNSEYYYRQDGFLRLQAVYEKMTPEIDLKQLKGLDYDYTKFCGAP